MNTENEKHSSKTGGGQPEDQNRECVDWHNRQNVGIVLRVRYSPLSVSQDAARLRTCVYIVQVRTLATTGSQFRLIGGFGKEDLAIMFLYSSEDSLGGP